MLRLDLTMSLDGYVAGPNQTLEEPLGAGGMRLHEWVFGLESWRGRHGLEGGVTNRDSEVLEESLGATGAVLMGRRMFSGGTGPWRDDPNAHGWWGDDPPYDVPVFVLTHHAREPLVMQGHPAFFFITGGIEAALERAQAVAGDRDVMIAGGAELAQQYLAAGLVDELQIHIAPLLLGDGVRLFDRLGDPPPELEQTRVLHSPAVMHLRYRVVR